MLDAPGDFLGQRFLILLQRRPEVDELRELLDFTQARVGVGLLLLHELLREHDELAVQVGGVVEARTADAQGHDVADEATTLVAHVVDAAAGVRVVDAGRAHEGELVRELGEAVDFCEPVGFAARDEEGHGLVERQEGALDGVHDGYHRVGRHSSGPS